MSDAIALALAVLLVTAVTCTPAVVLGVLVGGSGLTCLAVAVTVLATVHGWNMLIRRAL